MTRTRKLVAAVLLVSVVAVSGVTAALATDTTETYAYLPDHSVYFYDVAESYAWAHREVDTLAVAGVVRGSGDHRDLHSFPTRRSSDLMTGCAANTR